MPFSPDLVQTIASRHGISGSLQRLPDSGMVNEAWLIGNDFVLRIANVEDADDEAERESLVVPLVRAAGVRTPTLIAAKTTRDDESPPYTIYERAKGELLGHLTDDPSLFTNVYRELGREIWLLNQIAIPESLITKLRKSSTFDAQTQLDKSLAKGVVAEADAKRIASLLEQLQANLGEREPKFLHKDIHPWNLFVEPTTRELTAIIDWGDAAWGDPAAEFASMPLFALTDMLQGYKDAGGIVEESFIAAALSLGIALSLWELRDLDPNRFDRQWWRMTPTGWDDTLREVDRILATE